MPIFVDVFPRIWISRPLQARLSGPLVAIHLSDPPTHAIILTPSSVRAPRCSSMLDFFELHGATGDCGRKGARGRAAPRAPDRFYPDDLRNLKSQPSSA